MGGFPGSVLLDGGQYHTSSTKRHPLGTRGYTQDGRVFRYARNGSAGLNPGMMCQAEASSADFEAEPIADATDFAVPSTSSTVFYLSTATSMATADAFADGYYMVTAGTTTAEVGQMLQIESCPKSDGAAGPSGNPRIYVYSEDKLVTALSTTDTITLQKNPYDSIIGTLQAAPTGIAVGVAVTDVAASYYFWLQTWGMACMRVSDTWDTGHNIIYASATGNDRLGEALPSSTLEVDKGAAIVGIAQYIGTDGYAGSAMLTLAP
jgi:hypothetical protein